MKQISIIIPINQSTNANSRKEFSVTKITEAFSQIDHDLRIQGINYEIILVTDNSTNITLQDFQIFPLVLQLKFYRENKRKKMSDLIIRGISLSRYDYIGILGTAPEYLLQIFERTLADINNNSDVTATLKTNPSSFLPYLFRMRTNPQNAALFFQKDIWDVINFGSKSNALFIPEFLKRSQEAGFTVNKHQIFINSKSLFRLPQNTLRELFSATKDILSLQMKKIPPIYIPSQNKKSMKNAGLFFKKQKYITHTTLAHSESASEVFNDNQVLNNILAIEFIIIGFLLKPLFMLQLIIGILSIIYFSDILFTFYLVLKTLHKSYEVSFSNKELADLRDSDLPIYTILCPLYKEAHMIQPFVDGIAKLEWPKDKLDVILLLEADDTKSIRDVDFMDLPAFVRKIVVPHSLPKTKPKACNYGLAYAKGEYTVIYDAEDIPDPLQLKKAYLGFNKLSRKVVCLQAKLNYYNTDQNLLTKFFTAEYSLWFDVSLAGLQSINTTIPLGGTSNHFRTLDIKRLHGWDPFNVAEDADLGMRLFKLGYRTAIIDSVTLEEANSDVKNWIRQRSRWIKGYMQTYLVHTRDTLFFLRRRGIHVIFFHLIIGGRIGFIFINPLMWLITLSYFVFYNIVGPTIQSLYPPFILYIAISSLIIGNYLYLFCYIIGCVKKEKWSLIKYTYLIPIYWFLISIAGWIALYQLLFKPHYWEKTVHGLHLKKKEKNSIFGFVLSPLTQTFRAK
jgi:cellulose synthase/poly-beta-1,6-N-acetylglucosamine synthase-like glycosyltransferase